jgi:hypothetical protein
MFSGNRKQAAEFCIDQFEKFFQALRKWDCDAVTYAEIHSAALFLCEDDDFEKILRQRWSNAKPTQTLPPSASPLDFAIEVAPDLVAGFFEALIHYMESYRGDLCGGQPAGPPDPPK